MNNLRIVFLQNNHNHPAYTGASLAAGGVGGTESSVIQLAEALAARGHIVYALNRLDSCSIVARVNWVPLHLRHTVPPSDIGIGINSNRVFWGVISRRKIAWLHNTPSNKQQFKRRNIFALLRHRPHAVLLGAYQSALLHRWLPYNGRTTIPYGIGDRFFLRKPGAEGRPLRAIFTSQPARGLSVVAEAWEKIHERIPAAELHVFCPQAKQQAAAETCGGRPGIVIRGSVSRAALAAELRLARAMLIPGVPDETYCLAAAEAIASGVPIVTLGQGALKERVCNGETGFIVDGVDDFAHLAGLLLTDNELWEKMHRRCVAEPSLLPWSSRVLEWEALFERLLAGKS